eukprot:CAMPEP_0185597508 /NCGR_PEP_ID=MMETSP0434-20130131/81411_1 /TAXON_ID=626734 ORGANISM="Favella taraikaensis, Strain Fe Narragansett Bay" /NCGR_SAMPLE_ID=MMETSP0434 /ASSEMBLY_ACC=CAM_ASM_000379 /LENGTH=93 /DNA_ID=CAMNT_0028226253 /DNA_START=896 /DNA_END=1177 /DNA_ORIENTATION=+
MAWLHQRVQEARDNGLFVDALNHTTQAVDEVRLGHFVLRLAQTADNGLQERVSVSSRLRYDYFFEHVEEAVSLLAHGVVCCCQILSYSLDDHC